MFPHRSLILAILRITIFSIEVPEAKSIMCLRQQPRARNVSEIITTETPPVHIIHRQGASLSPLIHSQCQLQV